MLLSTSPVSSTFGVRAFTLLAWQGRYKVLPSHFHPGLLKCKAELFEGKALLPGRRGRVERPGRVGKARARVDEREGQCISGKANVYLRNAYEIIGMSH